MDSEVRAAAESPPTFDDLAMLVRRLVYRLRKHEPDSDLATKAIGYLQRKGIGGSVLREHQADDGEPVLLNSPEGFEWLRASGFDHTGHGLSEMWYRDGVWWRVMWEVGGKPEWGCCVGRFKNVIGHIETVQQMAELCYALGIELEETGE